MEIHTNIQHRKNQRKGITPVLATIILIAITLIAAISVGGYVFGLFGSFTNTAQVSASVVTCNINPTTGCTLSLTNSGTATTKTTGVGSVTVAGLTTALTCPTGTAITGGASTAVVCTGTYVATAGQQISGSIALANSASVSFTGSATA